MNQNIQSSYPYQVGGSLPTNAPTYVKREADEQLYQALKEGDFCYVLNSRQMGKSSLQIQTMKRLQAEGFACIAIDITNIGTADITPEQWYAGIIDTIINSLELYDNFDLNDWWMQQDLLSPVNKLSKFFESVLLPSISQNIVIFIDEIDSILSLKFEVDDFFALIRECYNSRASQQEYERLTFVLLGVANPSDLIQDKQRTPFNIGKGIELTGFQLNEAEPLAQGLAQKTTNPMTLMDEILYWTGGQPFLTQKLCKLILNHDIIPEDGIKKWLRKLVQSQIINDWEAQDDPEHLKTIRDRILRAGGGQLAGRLLAIYREVLEGGNVSPVRIADTSEQIYLRLSGLVVEQQGNLKVYNHIYKSIFNLDWVNQELKDLRPDFYSQPFEAWFNSNCEDNSHLLHGENLSDALAWAEGKSLSSQDYQFITASQTWEFAQVQQKTKRKTRIGGIILATFLVLAAVFGGLAFCANNGRSNAEGELRTVKKQKEKAEEQKKNAETQRENAEKQRENAETQREKAETQAKNAETQAKNAETQREKAETQAKNAETQQKNAETQAKNAEKQAKNAEKQAKNAQAKVDSANKKARKAEERREKAQVETKKAQEGQKKARDEAQRAKADKNIVVSQKNKAQQQRDKAVKEKDRAEKVQRINNAMRKNAIKKQKVAEKELKNLKIRRALVKNTIENLREPAPASFNSPDGQHIVTISRDDNTAKVWDMDGNLLLTLPSLRNATGTERDANKGHQDWIFHVSFSRDGERIVTTSKDNTAKVWDMDGNLLQTLERHQDWVLHASFSPDGEYIITASKDKTAKIWDMDGNLLRILDRHEDWVLHASFSPDGRHIVTISADNIAKVWDMDGNMLQTFLSESDGDKGHQSQNLDASLSQDGRQIVTKSADNIAKVWDIDGNMLQTFLSESDGDKGHQSQNLDVSLSQDGKHIVTKSADGTKMWWKLNMSH